MVDKVEMILYIFHDDTCVYICGKVYGMINQWNQIALFRTKRGQTSDVFNEAAHLEKPFLNCGSHGIGFSVLDFVAWAWAAPG